MNILAKVQVAPRTQANEHEVVWPVSELLPAISVIGLGYVGAVSTACLASLGHRIIGCDIDAVKVEKISKGISPIHETGLNKLLTEGRNAELISTTTDISEGVAATDVTFVSVGTPTNKDGGCDFSYIVEAARAIGKGLKNKTTYHVVVLRCSVPPKTTMDVMVPEIERSSGKTLGYDFGVCFNPEFLREGSAIADFAEPPKTVIGASDERAANVLAKIYNPVDNNILTTTIEEAELVKYADNVWHATKVCFANEIGRLCKPLEIDSHRVMDVFVQDTKLNLSPYYLKPGFAYGGSCLPKEVRAVSHLADELEVDVPLVASLAKTNANQIDAAVKLVRNSKGKRIGFLGLAFKAGTDDLRESPILEVAKKLMDDGYQINAYDPAITPDTRVDKQFAYVQHSCPHLKNLIEELPSILLSSTSELFDTCDVVVVSQKTDKICAQVSMNMSKASVIDLVRLFQSPLPISTYQGIGW